MRCRHDRPTPDTPRRHACPQCRSHTFRVKHTSPGTPRPRRSSTLCPQPPLLPPRQDRNDDVKVDTILSDVNTQRHVSMSYRSQPGLPPKVRQNTLRHLKVFPRSTSRAPSGAVSLRKLRVVGKDLVETRVDDWHHPTGPFNRTFNHKSTNFFFNLLEPRLNRSGRRDEALRRPQVALIRSFPCWCSVSNRRSGPTTPNRDIGILHEPRLKGDTVGSSRLDSDPFLLNVDIPSTRIRCRRRSTPSPVSDPLLLLRSECPNEPSEVYRLPFGTIICVRLDMYTVNSYVEGLYTFLNT